MTSPEEARLKRIRMRAWRRGTKEMDLVLGHYADEMLPKLSPAALDALESLMNENDQDLMAWMLGQFPAPAEHAALLDELKAFTKARLERG